MPTIYRAMKQTDDGLPAIGAGSRELGVRTPPNLNADIELDDDGNVILNGNGMSVVENWRNLLPHLVPKRLKPIFSGAAGSNKLACFRFGEGALLSRSSERSIIIGVEGRRLRRPETLYPLSPYPRSNSRSPRRDSSRMDRR